jgi:hypothetical protein
VASSFAKSERCDFNLWGILRNKMYINNTRTEDDVKKSIQGVASEIALA